MAKIKHEPIAQHDDSDIEPNCIILFTGDITSTALAAWALDEGYRPILLFVEPDDRKRQAAKVARALGLKLKVVRIETGAAEYPNGREKMTGRWKRPHTTIPKFVFAAKMVALTSYTIEYIWFGFHSKSEKGHLWSYEQKLVSDYNDFTVVGPPLTLASPFDRFAEDELLKKLDPSLHKYFTSTPKEEE